MRGSTLAVFFVQYVRHRVDPMHVHMCEDQRVLITMFTDVNCKATSLHLCLDQCVLFAVLNMVYTASC